MQNITIQQLLRTLVQTQNQIQRQNIEEIIKEDPSQIYSITLFLWGHIYSNIHKNLAIDILYRL